MVNAINSINKTKVIKSDDIKKKLQNAKPSSNNSIFESKDTKKSKDIQDTIEISNTNSLKRSLQKEFDTYESQKQKLENEYKTAKGTRKMVIRAEIAIIELRMKDLAKQIKAQYRKIENNEPKQKTNNFEQQMVELQKKDKELAAKQKKLEQDYKKAKGLKKILLKVQINSIKSQRADLDKQAQQLAKEQETSVWGN